MILLCDTKTRSAPNTSRQNDLRRSSDQHLAVQLHRRVLIEDNMAGGHTYITKCPLDRGVKHMSACAGALGQ